MPTYTVKYVINGATFKRIFASKYLAQHWKKVYEGYGINAWIIERS